MRNKIISKSVSTNKTKALLEQLFIHNFKTDKGALLYPTTIDNVAQTRFQEDQKDYKLSSFLYQTAKLWETRSDNCLVGQLLRIPELRALTAHVLAKRFNWSSIIEQNRDYFIKDPVALALKRLGHDGKSAVLRQFNIFPAMKEKLLHRLEMNPDSHEVSFDELRRDSRIKIAQSECFKEGIHFDLIDQKTLLVQQNWDSGKVIFHLVPIGDLDADIQSIVDAGQPEPPTKLTQEFLLNASQYKVLIDTFNDQHGDKVKILLDEDGHPSIQIMMHNEHFRNWLFSHLNQQSKFKVSLNDGSKAPYIVIDDNYLDLYPDKQHPGRTNIYRLLPGPLLIEILMDFINRKPEN